MRFFLHAGLWVAFCSLVPNAQVATEPSAIPLTSCQSNASGIFERIDGSGSCVLGRALASLRLSTFVNLSVQAISVGLLPDGIFDGEAAIANVQYFFQVTGGNAGDEAPLLIATSLSTTASTNGKGFASLLTHTGSFGDTAFAVCTNESCGTTDPSFPEL